MITSPPASTAAPRLQSGALMVDALWDAMTGAYGSDWTAKFGDHDSSGIWGKALAKFHHQQIKTAIPQAIKHYTRRVPNMGQFLELCRKVPAPEALYQLEAPRKISPHEKQGQWLADLKDMMAAAAARGPMSEAERDRHIKILGMDDASIAKKSARYVDPGSHGACAYPGCPVPGAMTTSTAGAKSWFCASHFHGLREFRETS